MAHWDKWQLKDVTPSALRDWISDMDCTSKAIRNMLIPLRSVFEDALNDGAIDFNPLTESPWQSSYAKPVKQVIMLLTRSRLKSVRRY